MSNACKGERHEDTLDAKEVLEARLFSPADLPDGMSETHRELAASLA